MTITSDSTAYLGSFQTYHKYQILHHMFFIGLKPDINIVYSCQSLARYSHFCCWDFTDVTLAYEDGNLVLVDGLTCVRLVTPIWWLNYGQDFWSQILVKILRQPFGQILEGEVCSSFWGWNLVEILRLKFGWDLKAEVWSTFWTWSLTWKQLLYFGKDTQPFGPKCL